MLREYTVIDKAGLHARPASLLVQAASKYSNDIFIVYKDKKNTLKSILIIMALGIPFDASFGIEVIGDGKEEILNELEQLLKENRVI